MQEWNAVISVHEHGFRQAINVFGDFGEVKRTDFFNVLLLRARDVNQMLETLRERTLKNPSTLSFLARLIPITHTFTFDSADEFELKAGEILITWTQHLAGKSFYVRIRRRGFKGKISSPGEERLLDVVLLEALKKAGAPGRISFQDPDAIIAIETIGTWAGLTLVMREDLKRYPFIRLD
ncbi:MAG TPA: THUMP domain-containing protein [Nitrospirota bacterium]|nr:THUMP domain-containing protein [Nitrospirota bacterium]